MRAYLPVIAVGVLLGQEVFRAPTAGGGGGAPITSQYWVGAADGGLSAEKDLSGFTGLVVNTAGTPSVYGGASCTNQFLRSLNASGAGTCATVDDASVVDTITLTNLTQITTRAISDTTGTLSVARGGTNLTASADDNVMVGNATTWETKSLPSCSNATTSKLLYDTATNTFSCGTDQTGGGSSDTVLRLASDVSTGANVTPVNLTGMSFSATANTYYRLDILTATTAAVATTGFGVGINCTNVPQKINIAGYTQLANAGTSTVWSSIANNAIIGVTSGLPSAGVTVPGHGSGYIQSHASTTGTCQFIFRSETTAVATAKAGFTIIVSAI